jgi:hypothetical protein
MMAAAWDEGRHAVDYYPAQDVERLDEVIRNLLPTALPDRPPKDRRCLVGQFVQGKSCDLEGD